MLASYLNNASAARSRLVSFRNTGEGFFQDQPVQGRNKAGKRVMFQYEKWNRSVARIFDELLPLEGEDGRSR